MATIQLKASQNGYVLSPYIPSGHSPIWPKTSAQTAYDEELDDIHVMSIGYIYWSVTDIAKINTPTVTLKLYVDMMWGDVTSNVHIGYFDTRQTEPPSFTITATTLTTILGNESTYGWITLTVPTEAISNGICLRWKGTDMTGTGLFALGGVGTELAPYIEVEVPDVALSNLTVTGLELTSNTTINWTSTNQSVYELQVFKNNVVVYSTNGTIATSIVIPPNTLPDGELTFKVRLGASLGDTNYYYTEWYSTTETMYFDIPNPSISNIQVGNTDIYYNTIISWDSANQKYFELQAIQEENIVYSTGGTTSKNAIIVANTLLAKSTKFKIRVGNSVSYSSVEWSEWQETTITMVNILPTITSLEPSGLAQNKANNLTISFVAQNYNTYILHLKQNNVILQTYTGTTQNTIIVPSNTLSRGTASLELTVTRAINNTIATRTATFTVYSNPDAPTQDQNLLFNNSKPTLTWASEEQVNYELEITSLSNTVIEAKTGTTAKTYTLATDLLNNTSYLCKIRVKNNYNLWSTWSIKQFAISYTELPKPTIALYVDNSNVRIEIVGANTTEFLRNEVWRKADGEEWIRLATGLSAVDGVTDYTVADGIIYYYKIRSRSTIGASTDSEVKAITTKVNWYNLTNVNTPTEIFTAKYEVQSNYENVGNISSNVFAGNSKLTTEYGEEDFIVASFSFVVDREDLENLKKLASKHPTLCVRDWHGNKFFGNITSNLPSSYDKTKGMYTASITITETDFTEEDLLLSNGIIPTIAVLLNGSYLLDGSTDLSGVLG